MSLFQIYVVRSNLDFQPVCEHKIESNGLLSRDNKALSCTHKLAKSLSLSEKHNFEITTFFFCFTEIQKVEKTKMLNKQKKSSENKKKSSENKKKNLEKTKKNLEKTNLLKKCCVSPLQRRIFQFEFVGKSKRMLDGFKCC